MTTIIETLKIKANETITILDNKLAYQNCEDKHFRLFATRFDAITYLENQDNSLVVKEFDNYKLLESYLEICSSVQIGTIVQNIVPAYNMEIEMNKFYKIKNADRDFIHFDNNISIFTIRNELFKYFRIISCIEDIENLENKALILKETFEQLKIMSESAEEKISNEALINETIAFLIQDEVYQGDEVELRFICDNMDITMVEKCSCCGKVLFPDDECYEDDTNHGATLCDHCSAFDDENGMYIKTVHQDVIEEITGLRFSHLVGNAGSIVKEFNYYLTKHGLQFGVHISTSRDTFVEYICEHTELNICDCCNMIEKSNDMVWLDEEFFTDKERSNACFIGSVQNFVAVCQNCFDMFATRTILTLEEATRRLNENSMLYRVGDIVVVHDTVNFEGKGTVAKTYIDNVVSIDENDKSYCLKSFENIKFKREEILSILDEAYATEYVKFMAINYPDVSENVDDWFNNTTYEGVIKIGAVFDNFGYKNEFIAYLISANLAYDMLLTPKFKIGDRFDVHFSHYAEGEIESFTVSKIDKSFTEANEIVYWSDEFVYITESEMAKQYETAKDEVTIVRDDILHNIFCLDDEDGIVVPTFDELLNAKTILPQWQLCEKYEDYSYDSLLNEVYEQCENFFITLDALNRGKTTQQSENSDEFENLCYENKMMGNFLEMLGLTPDDITSFVINGSKDDMQEMIKRIKA